MKKLFLIICLLLISIPVLARDRVTTDARRRSVAIAKRDPREKEEIDKTALCDKKIAQAKEQLFRLMAKKISLEEKISYKTCLEMVKKDFEILVINKQENKEKGVADRDNSDIAYRYRERKEYIFKNDGIRTFKMTYPRSMRTGESPSYYKVTQVIGNGYYLITNTNGSMIHHLYAPALNMVDDNKVPDIFVNEIGTYEYVTVLGSKKTINSYMMVAYCY